MCAHACVYQSRTSVSVCPSSHRHSEHFQYFPHLLHNYSVNTYLWNLSSNLQSDQRMAF